MVFVSLQSSVFRGFAFWLSLLAALPAAADEKTITYEQHVRPILKAHCFHCHGEQQELAGGLDLRLRHLIVSGGDSGPALELGDHAASLLYEYVRSGMMPPAEEQQLSAEELATIARWIDAGAPTAAEESPETPRPGEFLVTAQERSHWSLQPIRRPPVPRLTRHDANNPLDAFIGRRLEQQGLTWSPPADKRTLIRRATWDLLGLPPTPGEVQAFLDDDAPDAYQRLIDRLLASPRYGERWGRHWLDVAGYADSEGYNDEDLVRPDAWGYRDYVIRSFNADKPWNEFLTEQLAGDELAGATHADAQRIAERDPAGRELLAATGFLRMAPDGSGSRPMDPLAARNQVLSETIKVVSSALLGMTVGCAECHHHRYDPIPQQDFYRLRAVLAPVFDVERWRNPDQRRAAILSEEERARAAEIEAEARNEDQQHDRIKQEVLQLVLERVLEQVPEERREYARRAFETAVAERDAEQQQLVEQQYPMLGLLRTGTLHLFLARFKDGDELKQRYEQVKAKADELRAGIPKPDYLRLATEDPAHVPITRVFHRGDFTSPQGPPVPPGGLTVIAEREGNTVPSSDPSLPSTGRRLAYARYLTSGRHPLLARVLVNRFWMHHFGRGLVSTPGDFGTQGERPTHPELLDWLASEFMAEGWSLKGLHREIMTSRTYCQSSLRRPEAEGIDKENRLLWRMPVRRLEAEIVRDAMLAVSGQLDRGMFGPPSSVAVDEGGVVTVQAEPGNNRRRSVYVQVRRSQPVALLEAFDVPSMEPNCERRVFSTVATQSLALLNSHFALEQSLAFADRVIECCGADSPWDAQIDCCWQLAYGQVPGEEERALLRDYLNGQEADLERRGVERPRRRALATLCQVLLGSNRFLYVD